MASVMFRAQDIHDCNVLICPNDEDIVNPKCGLYIIQIQNGHNATSLMHNKGLYVNIS